MRNNKTRNIDPVERSGGGGHRRRTHSEKLEEGSNSLNQ